jgi:hypothetical protein
MDRMNNGSTTGPGTPIAPEAASADTPIAAPARRFLTELTHAMQAAAEHQREATAVELQAATAAHLERVRLRAAAEADELRRMAQEDVDGIHAWQRAEADRIREEAERRILARGQELDGYLVRHGEIIDGEVEQIEGAIRGYQLRLDAYFDQLTTQSSPAEIAKLADELPEPPDLVKVGGAARVQAVAALAAESEDTNGATSSEASSNPALRLLRSLATLAAPVKTAPVESNGHTDATEVVSEAS